MKNTHYNQKHLKEHRRALRNNGTSAEAILWRGLKNKQIHGLKFRRQFSVDNYILDFYCVSKKVAIELDGSQHFTAHSVEMDAIRDNHLQALGIKIIRFHNQDIYQNEAAVLEIIKEKLVE
ncbi:MAG: endonuclease domain-containing protein [Cytophagia bacterium]|nr:endonuclease domain-containing protein [Cytophagia bacterium]